jgi:methylenetetrahydrofolate dehydrogenase (NADP+) / methenyltetrahydrofolate cyclohydrolase
MRTKPSSSTRAEASAVGGTPVGRILDGRQAAREVYAQVRREVEQLMRERGVRPSLAAILVGDDAPSRLYIENKQRACREVGIDPQLHRLPADITEDELVHLIYRLNRDSRVHGILVQLPLPERALENAALAEISPDKDVDGLSPASQAALLGGQPGLRPCTPLAVMELIDRTGIDLTGKRAVVIGTSALVGKPLALLLLERNATVVLCHEFTADLPAEVGAADVLISAVGKAGLISGEWVRPGAVVIDVGINRTPDGVRGDVDFESARQRAGFITPVPGGVGPMTVAMLVRNTLRAAQRLTYR